MKSFSQFIVCAGLVLSFSVPAHAVPVTDQIAAAINNNDHKLVQTLVKDNPQLTGKTEDMLLKNVFTNVEKQPQGAAKTMLTASMIAPGITPKDASMVAEGVRKIVKLIADKALFVCNPEANANTSQVKAGTDGKNKEDMLAIHKILGAAEDVAKTPAIVAVDPKLFADISAMRSRCEMEDAMLAESPKHRVQHLPPNITPPPLPPPPASPD